MTLYDSTVLNENKHHQIYNKTNDEMSIEQTPTGAPDSNGLYQYDYADLSAGSSTNGTPQLKMQVYVKKNNMLFLAQRSLDLIEYLQLEITNVQRCMHLQCQLPIIQKYPLMLIFRKGITWFQMTGVMTMQTGVFAILK